MDAQRGLLRHGAAHHEDGGGLSEQPADLRLERFHHATTAVTVDGRVGRNGREDLARAVGAMATEPSGTGGTIVLEVVALFGLHGALLYPARGQSSGSICGLYATSQR